MAAADGMRVQAWEKEIQDKGKAGIMQIGKTMRRRRGRGYGRG